VSETQEPQAQQVQQAQTKAPSKLIPQAKEDKGPRVGIYVECDVDDGRQFEHAQNIMKALKRIKSASGENYDIYVYSSKRTWKRYCKEHSLTYRPFPTSGASNRLGKMLFGQHIDSPKPPEWVREMLKRKVDDFSLEFMIFTSPTNLVKQFPVPSMVVMHDLAATAKGGKYDAEWYSDLYQTVLENATAVLVDHEESLDYLKASLAKTPADIKMLSLEADLRALGENLNAIIRSITST